MKLRSAQIGPFRNFVDSGVVEFDPEVTGLVGKNESGKTNLLRALQALNPASQSAPPDTFDKNSYPSWLRARHRKSGAYDKATALTVDFDLDDSDVEAIAAAFGKGVLSERVFETARFYDSKVTEGYLSAVDEKAAVLHILSQYGHTFGSLKIGEASTIATLRESLSALTESEDAATITAAVDEVYGIDGAPVQTAVIAALLERLPRFFYFDDVSRLQGVTDLAGVLEHLNDPGSDATLDPAEETTLSFMRMGDADGDIATADYQPQLQELKNVGGELTRTVRDYWTQNPHLQLDIDIHRETQKETVKNQQNQPVEMEIVKSTTLRINVEDTRTGFPTSLDDRSGGFRWLISFIAGFHDFAADEDVIVLLDEPGAGLHGKAQADFLRFIEEQVAPSHQVVYTTHSPFMIDTSKLHRLRVVEDLGPAEDIGSRVIPMSGSPSDPDTLFPLQAALGYDISQNLYVGKHNLIVEGPSDLYYLTVMSGHLAGLGRTYLDDQWRILEAHGKDNIATLVSFVGAALDPIVMCDTDAITAQRVKNLIEAKVITRDRFFTPTSANGYVAADIEDMFRDDEYLYLYNAAFSKSLGEAKLIGSDTIVKRIGRAERRKYRDHLPPARYLMAHQAERLPTLSSETVDRFEALFEAINGAL